MCLSLLLKKICSGAIQRRKIRRHASERHAPPPQHPRAIPTDRDPQSAGKKKKSSRRPPRHDSSSSSRIPSAGPPPQSTRHHTIGAALHRLPSCPTIGAALHRLRHLPPPVSSPPAPLALPKTPPPPSMETEDTGAETLAPRRRRRPPPPRRASLTCRRFHHPQAPPPSNEIPSSLHRADSRPHHVVISGTDHRCSSASRSPPPRVISRASCQG
ncbi:hypothetical protein DAI22_11g100800 [Oryza sativa Japonica Group]|nr:hypothetical protein DAI22_11g100800 [Oryza sativa Japonica Group]